MKLADELETLAAKATPGPWEVDTIENDGAYGSGPDAVHGFKSPVMLDGDGKALFDASNSDLIEAHEEYNEDGCYAWDDPGQNNFALIVALRNNLPAIIAALRAAEPGQDGDLVERVAEALWQPTADPGEIWDSLHTRSKMYFREKARAVIPMIRATERAAVVRWLRKVGEKVEDHFPDDLADAIERGEHKEPKP